MKRLQDKIKILVDKLLDKVIIILLLSLYVIPLTFAIVQEFKEEKERTVDMEYFRNKKYNERDSLDSIMTLQTIQFLYNIKK